MGLLVDGTRQDRWHETKQGGFEREASRSAEILSAFGARFDGVGASVDVYKAGFATSQPVYEKAVRRLFETLGWLEQRLEGRQFLVGDRLTKADVRLFTTPVRFDSVYHGHFKCNLRRLTDYPALWRAARALYQHPGARQTVDFIHTKRHRYQSHPTINPNRIVPRGRVVDWRRSA